MPIYTYTCRACGMTVDRIVPISDFKREQICQCGAVLKRVMAAPQRFKFKMSDREAANKAMNDDILSKNPAIRKAMEKHLSYKRTIF